MVTLEFFIAVPADPLQRAIAISVELAGPVIVPDAALPEDDKVMVVPLDVIDIPLPATKDLNCKSTPDF